MSNTQHYDVLELRSNMENMTSMIPLPEDVKLTPCDIGPILAEWNEIKNTDFDRYVLYLHGGGYCLGSIRTHHELSARISRAANAKSLVIEYRLAPENKFPSPIEDAVCAYRYMLQQKIPANKIAIVGDSAGGGLTIATLLALRAAKEPLPAAAVCLSPWVDMEGSGESTITRAKEDPMLSKKDIVGFGRLYLGKNNDPKNPLASPIYADLTGLPPILIQVGDHEILLDDSRRLAKACEKHNVPVELQVWPNMVHVWQLFSHLLPEAEQAISQVGNFLRVKVK